MGKTAKISYDLFQKHMKKVVKDIDSNEIATSFYREDLDYGFKGLVTAHATAPPYARYTVFWGTGLYRASYNINTGEASYTQLYTNRNIIYTCAVKDSNGYLYFGTQDSGLHRMTTLTSANSSSWSITTGTVYDILQARNGNMYFASTEGFYVKAKGTTALTRITLAVTPQKLAQGLDGTIYICTNAGIYTMPENSTSVSALYSSNSWKHCVAGLDGTIWFGTDSLIYKLKTGTASVTNTGFSGFINCLYAEKNSSRIWCCCSTGIYVANSGSTNLFSALAGMNVFTAYEYNNCVYFGSTGKIIKISYVAGSRACEEIQINDIPAYTVNAFDEDDNCNLLLAGTGVLAKEKEKHYSRTKGKWERIPPNSYPLSKHLTINYSNESDIKILNLDSFDRVNIKFNYPDWSNTNLSFSDFYKLPKVSCTKEIRCLTATDFSGSGTLSAYLPENLLQLTKCGITYKFYIESTTQYQSILPDRIFTIYLKFDFITSDICNVYVSVPYNNN